jgi:hypothetical protein
MGKRTHALNPLTTVPTNAGSYRMSIDNPGWTESLYITLTQLKSFIQDHAPVTLASPSNGLALGTGVNSQQLTITQFNNTHAGVCPRQPVAGEIADCGLKGMFLNALGQWIPLYNSGGGGALSIIPPSSDGNFALDTGSLLFGSTEVLPLGIASLYSDTVGEVKTNGTLNAVQGIKLGGGDILLQIKDGQTITPVATGEYLKVTTNIGGVENIVYLQTFIQDV